MVRPPRVWARSPARPPPSSGRPPNDGGVASQDEAAAEEEDREVSVVPDREGEGASAADSVAAAGVAEAFEVGAAVEALVSAAVGARPCPSVVHRRALAAAPHLRTVGRPGKAIKCANNNTLLETSDEVMICLRWCGIVGAMIDGWRRDSHQRCIPYVLEHSSRSVAVAGSEGSEIASR